MSWKSTTQSDLVDILFYPQNQYGLNQIGLVISRITEITPLVLATQSIDRIELSIAQFWAADKYVNDSAIGSSADGRILAKADVLEWATNDRLIKEQSKRLHARREEIRERIRIALNVEYGLLAPNNLQGNGNRRVRS